MKQKTKKEAQNESENENAEVLNIFLNCEKLI